MRVQKEVATQSPVSPAGQTIQSHFAILSPPCTYFTNIDQGIIAITEDRLKLNAMEYDQAIKNSQNWHAPISGLITLLLAFCTSDFHQFGPLSAQQTETFFYFLFIANIVWLVRALIQYKQFKWPEGRKISTPDELVEACKKPLEKI